VQHDPDEGQFVLCSANTLDDPLAGWSDSFNAVLEDLGLVLGDFVHNSRGALDHVVFRLARNHLNRDPTESESRSIQFPIYKDPGAFANSAVLGFVCGSAGAAMEQMQPYHAADSNKHPLAVLHWLSNRDKHRLVTPSFFVSVLADVSVAATGGELRPLARDFEAEPFRVFDGRVEWARFEVIPFGLGEVNVEINRQPPTAIGFSGPTHNIDLDELGSILDRAETNVALLDRFL
jgi:hypothetical protein